MRDGLGLESVNERGDEIEKGDERGGGIGECEKERG